jgi:hypothetical protein
MHVGSSGLKPVRPQDNVARQIFGQAVPNIDATATVKDAAEDGAKVEIGTEAEAGAKPTTTITCRKGGSKRKDDDNDCPPEAKEGKVVGTFETSGPPQVKPAEEPGDYDAVGEVDVDNDFVMLEQDDDSPEVGDLESGGGVVYGMGEIAENEDLGLLLLTERLLLHPNWMSHPCQRGV